MGARAWRPSRWSQSTRRCYHEQSEELSKCFYLFGCYFPFSLRLRHGIVCVCPCVCVRVRPLPRPFSRTRRSLRTPSRWSVIAMRWMARGLEENNLNSILSWRSADWGCYGFLSSEEASKLNGCLEGVLPNR